MTREEKQKAIGALKISVPIMAVTQEEFKDYIQSLNKIMDWLEQEPTDKIFTKAELDSIVKAINEGWGLRVNEVLDKLRAEISEYGSIWVQYQITGRSDKDIQQLVSGVLKQAKEQVLDVIDKYKAGSEE